MSDVNLETMTIGELGLKTKTYNALNQCQVRTGSSVELERDERGRILVKSLLRYSGDDLRSRNGRGLWGFGVVSQYDLEQKLAKCGLRLAEKSL